VSELEPSGHGWALQPLLDTCGLTRSRLAAKLGVSGATLRTASRRGLTERQADDWAIRLGLHPLMVWGWSWIEEAANVRRPASSRFADVLRNRIARGELRPGSALPGVHLLARQSGVGVRTVVAALDQLRAEGQVVGGRGRGRHAVVASTVPIGSTECAVCAQPIAPADERYPQRSSCSMALKRWCDCGQAAHPECCPSCASGGAS
jgi:hypothetical protein